MSAWLIGRNFINARSIEIGDDIEEVRGWRTATRFYVSVFERSLNTMTVPVARPLGTILSYRKSRSGRSCRDAIATTTTFFNL